MSMTDRTKRSLIAGKLRKLLKGDVLTDERALDRFSRDQSIYEIRPLAAVFPSSMEDLQRTILFASNEGLHITPRGGGSGTAGSALGNGIVIALQHGGFLGQIADFSVKNGTPLINLGAGVYHNELQEYLRARGFFLPADVSSAKISQIGGNIATKASGPHALKYGSIDRFIENIEFFTARGELVNTADETTIPVRIKEELMNMARRIGEDEQARSFLESRQNMKTASGYNLFSLIHGYSMGRLLAQLFAGSNGTLGFITGASLRGEIYEPARAVMLLYFDDLAEVGEAVSAICNFGAAALEIMNRETVRVIRERSKNRIEFSENAHMLLIEFEGRECFDEMDKIAGLIESEGYRLVRKPVVATSEEDIEKLWEMRKRILPFISNLKPPLKAFAIVNDVGVSPSCLVNLINDLQVVFRKHDIETLIYGHAGDGNLHLRPLFDLSKPDMVKRIKGLADDVYNAVFRYGGTISGEHGVGRLKAPYLEREWGENLFGYMKEVKNIFDPQGTFNPDVIFSNRSITDDMRRDLLTLS